MRGITLSDENWGSAVPWPLCRLVSGALRHKALDCSLPINHLTGCNSARIAACACSYVSSQLSLR